MPTFPLTLPAAPGFSRVTPRPHAVVGMTVSPFSLKQNIQEFSGEAWVFDVVVGLMNSRAEGAAWEATFLLLNGRANTFLFGNPADVTARGSVPGAPQVDGAGQTGRTVNTKGWTASQTGILLVGDTVQVGSGALQRLYKITEDANSDGGGLAALSIWPRLRESPTDSETLVVANCKGTFRLASNTMPWDTDPKFYEFTFVAVEAI